MLTKSKIFLVALFLIRTFSYAESQNKFTDGKPGRLYPNGFYRNVGFARPVWDKVKFELDQNITEIEKVPH
jgi:hypothetical protein